jgi:uncharacterized protein (TIGR02001 family)
MQMRNVKWVVASVALAVSGAASAGEWSSTVTATSDYDFRGVTQTAGSPAIQGSLDWAADNGIYVGTWASKVDFGDCCGEVFELDLYAGFAGGDEEGLTYDVGGLWYSYPGASELDYPEVFAGIAYGMFDAKIWYSWDEFATGESAFYYEGNVNLPLPADLGLSLHVGYSDGDAFDKQPGYQSYTDYSIGLTRSVGHFDLELKWVDGSDWKDLNKQPGDVLSSDARLILSVSTTFPWGE